MITIADGELVYGVQLPIQAQSSYFVADWERAAGPAELARIARAADEHGFFYIGVCDHVAVPRELAAGMGTHWSDTLTTLAWLAGQTSRVNLLSHVYVLSYRHPLVAAKGFATLDHLSGGRAICGIGAGHVGGEFATLGVEFRSRGRLLDEALPVFLAALEHEFPDVTSGRFAVADAGVRPRPAQEPRPPVWIAGSSPAAIRRAARVGDGWLPQGPSNPEMVAALRRELVAAGRAELPMAIGHITPFLHVGEPTWDVGDATVAGPPGEVADGIRSGVAVGVNQLQVRFKARGCDELIDQMASFARDVAPLLAAG